MTAEAVADRIAAHRFAYTCERDLQDALAVLFPEACREVRLGAAGVIDLVVGRVGVEVKVDGSMPAVARQVDRYARSGLLDAVVVVTNRAKHRAVAGVVTAVPVTVVHVGAGL